MLLTKLNNEPVSIPATDVYTIASTEGWGHTLVVVQNDDSTQTHYKVQETPEQIQALIAQEVPDE